MPKIVLVILGILVVIFFIVLTVSFIANILFDNNAKKEVGEFFTGVEHKDEIIQKSDLEGLPPSIQKWLAYSQVVGKERITAVRSKQTAVMRMKEEKYSIVEEGHEYVNSLCYKNTVAQESAPQTFIPVFSGTGGIK